MATRSIHNSAVSLDQAKCHKSGQNSVGEVGGSLTVVQPVCTIEIDENINDGKFTDANQLKQFQGTQICKIAEEPVSKEAEAPGSKEPEEPGSKEPEEPLSREAEEPGSKEPQEPVSREADEPVSKEQDIDYCASKSATEQETTDEIDNVSSTLMAVGSTEFIEQEECAGEHLRYIGQHDDVSHRSNSSNIEETESTKITGGDNITSENRDQKSESVDPVASENSRNLDIETNLNPIMYSSTDYELENTETDVNRMATSSAYDRPKFEDDFEFNVKPESGNEYVANYTAGAGIDSSSHGDVDGFIPTRPVSNSETDQSNTDNEDDLDMIKVSPAEKMKLLVDDIVGKTKVVYKLYNGCSCNTYLQVVFIFVAVLQSSIPDNLQTDNAILKHSCAAFDERFPDLRQHFVFAATFQFLFDLPDPNLPGIGITNNQNIFNNTLGVVLRPAYADTPNSEEDEELRDSLHTPPDSGVFSTLNDHPRETHSLQDSVERNRTDFISILSAPLSVTIREANENTQGLTAARVENVPELQTPSTEHIGVDVDNTNRKIRNVDENLTNIGPTCFSQDGIPTTWGNRRNEIQRAGSHGQDGNSISGVASQLSTSVSTHSVLPPSDHLTTGQNRMTNMQARADTFDTRWPHSHLKPEKMAEAGFYFTGERDATRCFWCHICLRQWEKVILG